MTNFGPVPARRSTSDAAPLNCLLCGGKLRTAMRPGGVATVCPTCGLGLKQSAIRRPKPAAVKSEPCDPALAKLDHWLSGETIRVKEEGDWQRLRRWIRKHPWVGRFVAAMLVGAVVVPVGSLTAYVRTAAVLRQTKQERDAADQDCRELSEAIAHQAAALKLAEERAQGHQIKQQELEQQYQQLRGDYQRCQQLCQGADQTLRKAVREARLSLADQFTCRAEKLEDSLPEASLALAAEALNITQQEGVAPIPAALKQVRDLLTPSAGVALSGNDDPVAVLAASRDGHWLASGDGHGMVRLWATSSATPVDSPKMLHGQWDRITQLLFTSDNRWLVSSSTGSTICLWDLMGADPIAKRFFLQGKPGRVVSISLSEDGRWLAAASTGASVKDNCVRLWDLHAKELIANPIRLPAEQGEICVVAMSSDGNWIASTDHEGVARLWRTNDQSTNVAATVLRLADKPVRTVSFSADGQWLVTAAGTDGGKNCTICVWKFATTGVAAEPIALTDESSGLDFVATTNDGKWLIAANQGPALHVWNLSAIEQQKAGTLLTGQSSGVQGVSLSADGRWLATTGSDGVACLWSIGPKGPSGPPIEIRPVSGGITSVGFAAKGDWIAAGNDRGTIQMWNLRVDDLIRMANAKLLP
jgi:WD40 repeat protein